jgi:hypothetical protein
MKKTILIFFVTVASMFAQDLNSYMELIKSDMKTEKKKIITEAMQFSENESKTFWDLYGDYELSMDKLANKRIEYIKDFAQNYPNVSNKKADEIMKKAFDYFEDRLELRSDFYDDVKDKLGAFTAAKYIQLDMQMQLVIDIQVSAALPLLDKAMEKRETENK